MSQRICFKWPKLKQTNKKTHLDGSIHLIETTMLSFCCVMAQLVGCGQPFESSKFSKKIPERLSLSVKSNLTITITIERQLKTAYSGNVKTWGNYESDSSRKISCWGRDNVCLNYSNWPSIIIKFINSLFHFTLPMKTQIVAIQNTHTQGISNTCEFSKYFIDYLWNIVPRKLDEGIVKVGKRRINYINELNL